MNDVARTLVLVFVAAALAGLAWFTRATPADIERFSDVGTKFYPDFTDPLAATSLEVIQFDEASGTAVPFKVESQAGVWTIPSHYNYPADARDRLTQTATSVIDLRRDIIQSDRAQDHASLGLIDPLDDTATSLTGRGERITLRNESGSVLADFIIGKPVPNKQGYRYVRLPGQNRSYAVQVNVDLSTRFADWINTELLEIEPTNVQQITINDYSIDETSGTISNTGRLQLDKLAENRWESPGLTDEQRLDQSRVQAMVRALAGLTITGVRPKPASLTSDLRSREGISLDMNTRLSLESKGFFISQDGRLLSNEGEITVGTKAGVRYVLRFGEVIMGEGLSVTAGTNEDTSTDEFGNETGEGDQDSVNRYVFITAEFDESLLPPKPVAPAADAATDDQADQPEDSPSEPQADDAAVAAYERQLQQWQQTADEGRETAQRLNHRFAEWYYVISATDFSALRPSINDLVSSSAAATSPPQQPAEGQ